MSRLRYSFTVLLVNLISYILVETLQRLDNYSFVFCSLLSLMAVVIQLWALRRYVGALLSPYPIFMISFVVFNFGLFWIYGLGIDFNYFYLNSFSSQQQIKGISFEMLCSGAMFLAGANCKTIKPFRMQQMSQCSESSVESFARMGLMISTLFAFALLFFKAHAFAQGLYEGVRQFERNVPTYISIIEYFFVPFSVLHMVYCRSASNKRNTMWLLIVWSVSTALLGDRTSGIGGILVATLINFKYSGRQNQNERIQKRNYIFLGLGIVTAFLLISVAGSFREGNHFSDASTLFGVIGEMGGSFLPLLLIMEICPSIHPYLLGRSYFYTLLTGFIPETLDLTGIVHQGLNYVIEPIRWIESDFDYTFGTGYSLCAEAYANFGTWGFIALYFIGLLIIKVLQTDINRKFSVYTSMVMLFELFTLPRRNSYYILNHSFYCILVMAALILIMTRRVNNR